MGSFVFKWDHPATEVYVTGTFDGWKKTEKLEKVGDHFEKNVTVPDASEKIFYKFVVDGDWVTDHTAPKEADESGNENNVLTPERIVSSAPATTAMMNSAHPDSTTAALAADAPLEKKEDQSGLPGSFPETPALEKTNSDFGINPMPAGVGGVNPIKLAPGEKIPEGIAAESTTSHVKLDPESYAASDALPGGFPAAFSSTAPESSTAALAAGAPIETKVPEVVKESQAKAHVDAEASGVPEEVQEKAALESELLDKVKEAPSTSEGTSGYGTEKTEKTVDASEAAAAVAAAATALGGAAVAGAFMAKDAAIEKAKDATVAAQASATEAATNLPDSVKEKLPESVQNAIGTTTKEETREEVSPEVPTEVKQSITEAEKDPEAAANTEAVVEKKAMEAELLKEITPAQVTSEPAIGTTPKEETREEVSPEVPTEVNESITESGRAPEAAANTEAVVEKKAMEAELLKEITPAKVTSEPGKAETPAATETKPAEGPLPVLEPLSALAAPVVLGPEVTTGVETKPVETETEPVETKPVEVPEPVIEPASSQTAPVVTTGVETKPTEETTTNRAPSVDPTTPAKPVEPAAGTPSSSSVSKPTDSAATADKTDSPSTTDKKKKNRLSAMFGKVKTKLSNK
ncbi:Uu.00g104080.m01.CDS01 [Anthostomella pinea]|uniref:Uu.00g104080.m01.CDS01 n=1 Tax=Anthostomella pinea TaxID=933095 RepID=A0AAI8YFN9_9PEZI|nr:Uu.00g104080.m01.CDS01 [Anthostomella pinea]